MLKYPYKLLEIPLFYTLSQLVFAPGAGKKIQASLQLLSGTISHPSKVLDVGCGPASWLWKLKWKPIGLDIAFSYARKFHATGQLAVTSSCMDLPFDDDVFDGVWTIGLLHHLSDSDVKKTIFELFRVCCSTGTVIILDAVLPEPHWRRPIASLIRKMDRGKFMRTQQELAAFVPGKVKLSSYRFTYALTGLEMLAMTCTKLEEFPI